MAKRFTFIIHIYRQDVHASGFIVSKNISAGIKNEQRGRDFGVSYKNEK